MRGMHKLWAALGGVVVAAATLWWLLQPEPPRAAPPLSGRLELVAGEVAVETGGISDVPSAGMPLADGARIHAGNGARALVRLLGGASAFLDGGADVSLRGTGLTLNTGRVWLEVAPVPQPIVHDLGLAQLSLADAGVSAERSGRGLELYVARGLAVVAGKKGRREVKQGERIVITSQGEMESSPVAFWEDWTGGLADGRMASYTPATGSGRIYAVDREAGAGKAARPLTIQRQTVRARIADGMAETEVDQTFFNPGERPVEGFYWFTVPAHALVTGFALETNGVLVEGEVVEKKQAAATYEASIAEANDPALLEWIDDHTYRARIYPVPALGARRVVLRYVEPVSLSEGKLRWGYPLAQSEAEPATIDEFALKLDLGALGADAELATLPDARIEEGGRYVTMRRSMYTPRADFQVELTPRKLPEPLRVTRFSTGGDQADFVMLRWMPDLDFRAPKRPPVELLLAVDLSAGGDDADLRLKLAVAEAVLRNLAAGDRFALLTTDVTPRVIYPQAGLASAEPQHVSAALSALSARGAAGASDLGAMFDPGLSRLHEAEQPAFVYVGDGQATSGELRGAALIERLRRSLEGSRARVFTVGVGASAHHTLLAQLAAVGGGQHFRVDNAELAAREALVLTQAVKTPTITDLELDVGVGLDESLYNVSGKLARGQELVLLARTHHALPDKARIKGRLFGKAFMREVALVPSRGAATQLVPRLWAAEFTRRQLGAAQSPEEARGKTVQLALEYGLVTPFTSVLALDSEDAYARMGIQRRQRPWDRLSGEVAQVETSVLKGALAAALLPVALLTGCSRDQSAPVEAAAESTSGQAVPALVRAKGESAGPVPAPSEPVAPAANLEPTWDSDGAGVETAAETVGRSRPAPRAAHRREMERMSAEGKSQKPKSASRLGTLDDLEGGEKAVEHAPRAARYVALHVCSDVASRPLSDRLVLWQRRLDQAQDMAEALRLHDAARAACELSTQREQRTFLSMLAARADSAGAAQRLFAHFAHDAQAEHLLARLVLRRALDPYVVAAARRALLGALIDWRAVDLQLASMPSDEARIGRLREIALTAGGDAECELRLMKYLLRTNRRPEALALAARLRERGLLSPYLLRDLGELEVAAGLRDEALRTYSEIVEFDPRSVAARQLVGDTLLAHGYHDAAYGQYRTLVELSGGSPESQLRLSLAAAGAGRSDEALRILRGVAGDAAEPSSDDPRLFARLHASALLARLHAGANGSERDALARKLAELHVLEPGARLYVLTWDRLDAVLGLSTNQGDVLDAPAAGLVALSASELPLEALRAAVTLRSEHDDRGPVHYRLHALSYDGGAFRSEIVEGDAG
jgi:Ca-activated chloride channel family protein